MVKTKGLYAFILACLLISCDTKGQTDEKMDVSQFQIEALQMGADQTKVYLPLLKDKHIGLVVNQTSMIQNTHLVDSLLSLGINITTIFAPEHGFRGNHSAGAKVSHGKDIKTGLPIASLYGKNRKPNAEMLAGLDLVIFDIQDVGVRFYTYISTMHLVMEACAENKVSVLILDRPNPNGFYVAGPMRDDKYKSFIGMHPIPLVHGLTVGELAKMIVGEKWINKADSLDLKVVPCKGYTHQMKYRLPIAPSPNLPTMESIYLYPTLGLFEGTRMSIGRGTATPFELLGMPEGEGDYRFTPNKIPGVSDHPKFEGQLCIGRKMTPFSDSILKNPKIHLEWLTLYYQLHELKNLETSFFLGSFNKLAGSDWLKNAITDHQDLTILPDNQQIEFENFLKYRKQYLLYLDF